MTFTENSLGRKRIRDQEDDMCDLQPISKRINSLTLQNMDEENQVSYRHNVAAYRNIHNPPELNPRDNPHYYRENLVLYHAHLARQNRTNTTSSSDQFNPHPTSGR